MIQVKRLQNVYVVSKDVPNTAAFYEEVFGFKKKFNDGDRWVQFDVAGSNFSVGCPEEGVDQQTNAVTVFEVENLTEAEALITRHQGRVVAKRDMGSHGSVTTVHDPAGNVIQLFCRNGS